MRTTTEWISRFLTRLVHERLHRNRYLASSISRADEGVENLHYLCLVFLQRNRYLVSFVRPTTIVEKPAKAFQPCWWGVLTKRKKEGKKEEREKKKEEREGREGEEITFPHP
mgnify:CR=1 FL=1